MVQVLQRRVGGDHPPRAGEELEARIDTNPACQLFGPIDRFVDSRDSSGIRGAHAKLTYVRKRWARLLTHPHLAACYQRICVPTQPQSATREWPRYTGSLAYSCHGWTVSRADDSSRPSTQVFPQDNAAIDGAKHAVDFARSSARHRESIRGMRHTRVQLNVVPCICFVEIAPLS